MSEVKKSAKTENSSAEKPDKKYDLAVLRKSCVNLLGVTTSTFDGAMSGQKGPLSVDEAKNIIETWKKGVAK
ncbi:MAG: hypothetical protein K2I93_07490 [Oscillospiraceae bacterium]|nr:hypothetical protein [Oscillospiraceae bacterium]